MMTYSVQFPYNIPSPLAYLIMVIVLFMASALAQDSVITPVYTVADLPDPLISHYPEYGMVYSAQDLPYRRFTGPLFHDGISVQDVRQGRFSDCYLIAAIAMLAHDRPNIIADLIKDNGNGTYTGRFYKPSLQEGNVVFEEEYITVDADFPVFATDEIATPFFAGYQSYARVPEISPKAYELWPALLEKMLAIRQSRWTGLPKESYAAIHQRAYVGDSSTVLTTLTGQHAERMATRAQSKEEELQLFTQLLTNNHLRYPTTANTLMIHDPYEGTSIAADHNYVVIDVTPTPERIDARYTITLYNPWGYHEPKEPWAGDGIFAITDKDFMTYFNEIIWLEIKPQINKTLIQTPPYLVPPHTPSKPMGCLSEATGCLAYIWRNLRGWWIG